LLKESFNSLFFVLLLVFFFHRMLLTFVYWFILAPRCKVLSCGRTLQKSTWCPTHNPFSSYSTTTTTTTMTTTSNNTAPIHHSTRDGWIITNVLVLYIFNPSIIRLSLQMLQKETICGVEYWSEDDTVEYNSNIHQNWVMAVVVPALLLYGVVCTVLAVLYVGRHPDRQTNPKLMFRFGLLYSGFAPDYWWYELILYCRKVSIILIVTFASSNDQQLHLALGTLIVLLYVQEYTMPFENPQGTPAEKLINKKLHRIESCSLLVLISMVWSAVYFVIGCDDNDGVCSLLGVVVLGGNVVFLILCSAIFLKAFEKKHHIVEKLSKLTHSFRSSMSRGHESSSSVIDVNGGTVANEANATTTVWSSRGAEIRINPLWNDQKREEGNGTTTSVVEMVTLNDGSSSSSVKVDDDDDDINSLPR
jgi:hypothetical protein